MNIDKQLIRQRFAKQFASYHEKAVVQREMARRLANMIGDAQSEHATRRGLEIGIGTGFLSARLLELYPGAHWYLNDLAPEAFAWVRPRETAANVSFLEGDAESVPFPGELDLIASASALQWFVDPASFFAKARAALRPEGLLALGAFAPGNMAEIQSLTGMGLPYPPTERLRSRLEEKGFQILAVDEWTQRLFFPNAAAVARHIRETGVNAVAPAVWTPRRWRRFHEDYERRFSDPSGRFPLTYRPVLLLARACR